jgi:hypothetical protein
MATKWLSELQRVASNIGCIIFYFTKPANSPVIKILHGCTKSENPLCYTFRPGSRMVDFCLIFNFNGSQLREETVF